jgi:hypothetical protein
VLYTTALRERRGVRLTPRARADGSTERSVGGCSAALPTDEFHACPGSLLGDSNRPLTWEPRRFGLRTLAITRNITVDGSIEMLGDWFDPQGQADVDN